MMKNHLGQTENQIGIGRHQEAETKALNHTQNLPHTTDAVVPAMIARTLTNVNHDHDQVITQVLIIDQEKHQIIVEKANIIISQTKIIPKTDQTDNQMS
jgi:hypothetical protein